MAILWALRVPLFRVHPRDEGFHLLGRFGREHAIICLAMYFRRNMLCFSLSVLGIPIVYFEKNRVFKAGDLFAIEYISMG